VHLAARIPHRHFLMQDARTGGHPLHVARAQCAGIPQAVAMRDRAVEDIGDRLDPAMRMPGEAAREQRRIVVAEIVEQQEGVEFGRIAKAEGAVQMDARALQSRAGGPCVGDGTDRHGWSPFAV